jgi:hypothetical protein
MTPRDGAEAVTPGLLSRPGVSYPESDYEPSQTTPVPPFTSGTAPSVQISP